MDEFIGIIKMFAGNFAPRGWAFCQGQMLSISQNTALFSLLGTTYGGDGQTTFALPDLRGRTPVGPGQGPGLSNYYLGQPGGSETVTLTQQQIPAHTHSVTAYNSDGDASKPANTFLAANNYNTSAGTTMHPQMIGAAGGSQPHSNLQPYLAINYIICLEGIFPSRN